MAKKYQAQEVEAKWREKWKKTKLYEVDLDQAKKPFYNLMMFPYPSAEGLHVGNTYAFTGADIHARFKRMQGFDVFEPMGLDGFGIHSENYAISIGEHPADVAKKTERRFYEQLRSIGAGFSWQAKLETYDPDYYRWTQWIFIQMFRHGLVERKKSLVNWCPSCKTVLSDEQVEAGRCERCTAEVEPKETEQWFFKITKYTQKLLENLDHLAADVYGPDNLLDKKAQEKGIDWSKKVKTIQRNWIGKSEGVEEHWQVEGMDLKLATFTTWPHTTWGATFMVIAPEHPVIDELVKGTKYETGAEAFCKKAIQEKIKDPLNVEKSKEGFFLGRHVINHLNGRKMPLYIANFAIYEYGTGIVKCTPTHDQRDFEFAKKYDLDFIPVIYPKNGQPLDPQTMKEAYAGEGLMMNAGPFNDMPTEEARKAIGDYTVKQGNGRWTENYKLRDWCISRQRYWGPPIPMVNCSGCGWVPVPEKDLPVELPFVKDYQPRGAGVSPLAQAKDWIKIDCPQCGGKAERETDVSDTFLDSAWYFFRYPSVEFKEKIFDSGRTKKWLPVDIYIGGAEHSVLHLMYARFMTMAFKDMGLIDFEEPFKRFFAHGLLIRDGAKISKSKGNMIIPDEYIKKYGADTLRMYLMFLGPFEAGGDFRDDGIAGMHRFLRRISYLVNQAKVVDQESESAERLRHKIIKKVTNDLSVLGYNTAIAKIMEYVNFLSKEKRLSKESLGVLVLLLAPFAPHLAEELWEVLGNQYSVHQQPWPKYDPELVKEEKVTVIIQVNGRFRDKVEVDAGAGEKEVLKLAKASSKTQLFLKGKKIKKTVFVPDRLVNLVV